MIFAFVAAAFAECPEISVDDVIDYAASGVGSNYVWGGGTWDPSDRSWGGADCSGFVGKVWLSHLLWEVPEIGRVTLIVRDGGIGARERIERELDTSPAFRPLRERHGASWAAFASERVEVLAGDCALPLCGVDPAALPTAGMYRRGSHSLDRDFRSRRRADRGGSGGAHLMMPILRARRMARQYSRRCRRVPRRLAFSLWRSM